MTTFLPEGLVPFLLTALVVELTPGPNMAYLAALSATEGRAKGFAAVGGVALGLTIVGVAAALGLAAFVETSPVLWEALRWGGAAFLLYLAWEAWATDRDEDGLADGVVGLFQFFRRGLVTNLLNPKAAVFYVAILPGFVSEASTTPARDTVILSLAYVAVATGVHAALVVAAGSVAPALADPGRRRTVRRVFAVLLAGIAVWLLVTTGRR